MRRLGTIVLLALLVVAAVVAFSAAFTVHQTQQALILRFGEARRVIQDPGLHFKMPIAETAVFIDKRILDLDSSSLEVIASDQKRLVVDAFARYRIDNALRFYQSAGSVPVAESRLAQILESAVRRTLGDATFEEIVRDERPSLMREISRQVGTEADTFGIKIVDVRIRRADLPEANSQAVYDRMQTERQQEAADIRARGEEEAQRIRARADRRVRVIEAEAQRDAEVTRGKGDAERNRLYADAYGKDPEFFAFYRSMVAYEEGLKSSDTRLVISPDSDFFRFFKDPLGGAASLPDAVVGEPRASDAAATTGAGTGGEADPAGVPETDPEPAPVPAPVE